MDVRGSIALALNALAEMAHPIISPLSPCLLLLAVLLAVGRLRGGAMWTWEWPGAQGH